MCPHFITTFPKCRLWILYLYILGKDSKVCLFLWNSWQYTPSALPRKNILIQSLKFKVKYYPLKVYSPFRAYLKVNYSPWAVYLKVICSPWEAYFKLNYFPWGEYLKVNFFSWKVHLKVKCSPCGTYLKSQLVSVGSIFENIFAHSLPCCKLHHDLLNFTIPATSFRLQWPL